MLPGLTASQSSYTICITHHIHRINEQMNAILKLQNAVYCMNHRDVVFLFQMPFCTHSLFTACAPAGCRKEVMFVLASVLVSVCLSAFCAKTEKKLLITNLCNITADPNLEKFLDSRSFSRPLSFPLHPT